MRGALVALLLSGCSLITADPGVCPALCDFFLCIVELEPSGCEGIREEQCMDACHQAEDETRDRDVKLAKECLECISRDRGEQCTPEQLEDALRDCDSLCGSDQAEPALEGLFDRFDEELEGVCRP